MIFKSCDYRKEFVEVSDNEDTAERPSICFELTGSANCTALSLETATELATELNRLVKELSDDDTTD